MYSPKKALEKRSFCTDRKRKQLGGNPAAQKTSMATPPIFVSIAGKPPASRDTALEGLRAPWLRVPATLLLLLQALQQALSPEELLEDVGYLLRRLMVGSIVLEDWRVKQLCMGQDRSEPSRCLSQISGPRRPVISKVSTVTCWYFSTWPSNRLTSLTFSGVILQTLHLPIQITLLIHGRDTCIQRNSCGTLGMGSRTITVPVSNC
jgi:hypothetical protein